MKPDKLYDARLLAHKEIDGPVTHQHTVRSANYCWLLQLC